MRNKTTKLILEAASADKVSELINCNDSNASYLDIGFKLVTSDDNIVCTIGFAGNIEDDGDYANWPLLTFGLLTTLTPAQITLPTVSSTGAILTVATGMAAGTRRGLLRFASPPPFIVARYDWTSGGGTVALTLKASY